MAPPKFSILIPTRDRPDTFQHTLKTVIEQEGDDFEIVVADNCGSPRTREIVDKSGSNKIKYIRSDTILPMAENWEKGLAECKGEYVTVLGDDDGFLPSTLGIARNIINQTSARLVSWRMHTYWWPDTIVIWNRNRLQVIFGENASFMDKRDMLRRFYSGDAQFGNLPMIYNSFVHKSYIQMVTEKHGCYFAIPHIPDVFSGVVNLATDNGTWVHANRPLTVRGNSGKSNGTAQFARSLGEKQREQYFNEEKIKLEKMIHKDLVPSPNLEIIIANCKIRCKELLFPNDKELNVNIVSVITKMINALNNEPEAYNENLSDIMQLAEKHNHVIDKQNIPKRQPAIRIPFSGPIVNNNETTGVVVNGDLAGISDIYSASRLADALMPPL